MATSINADNGAVSGSAGLKSSADSSGVLALQTNGTTAVSISTAQVVSYTNQPVYSGGTANGVAYLNGSKVLTTGSALVFDGSNLGVGVTPSAWTRKAIQLGDAAAAYVANNSGGATVIATNMYFDGSNKYATTAAAARYSVGTGTHEWYNAASGTAGNAITFTQALTLDASGNLGIGTSSPSAKLNVSSTGNGNRALFDDTTNDNTLGIYSDSTDIRLLSLNNARGSYKRLGFQSNVIVFSASNGSESARIDSSGNLLVGGTTAGSTSPGIGLTPNGGGSGNGLIYCTGTATTSAASTYFMYSSGAAAYRFYVDFGGTIHATSASISAISDASLKTNIKDLETGLTEVMALKPRRFDWINGDATNVAGFIAQEVEQVLPELVIDSLYSNDENGNEIKKKNLKMGDILPTLVKAIQEQQALITQLQADVAALKGA